MRYLKTGEPQGAPRLVQANGCAVGQVQGAVARHHGDAHQVGDALMTQDLLGKTSGFRTEEQGVIPLPVHLRIKALGAGGEGENPAGHLDDRSEERR